MQVLRIRELRIQAGMEQKELADAVGVTQPHVSNWESGKRIPTTAMLPAIAKALGCTVNDLYVPADAVS